MKKINQLLLAAFLGSLALLCLVNALLPHIDGSVNGREYKISLNRVERAIEQFEQERGRAAEDLKELEGFAGGGKFPLVVGLEALENGASLTGHNASPRQGAGFSEPEPGAKEKEFWGNLGGEYAVVASEYAYYKVYYLSNKPSNRSVVILVNLVAGCFILLSWALLLYVRQKILLPFFKLSGLPYELSKGNLEVPLKENKNRFFGKFMWGMDVLRENLERQKLRELELQKEKKMLLLSLSHDIKTPLSAIHLYAQALSRNLYQDEGKKQEMARGIQEKAAEIEAYVSEIVKASNEDFLDFQVECKELYIGEALGKIYAYYQDKMELNLVEFSWEPYPNCLVWGDLDRLVEVMQNVVENAIKYGDGRKIHLSARREEEEYQVLICNTGCGLAPRELPHIFDSFFRGSNVGKNPGSGLGLYICRQLIHRMEGEITAKIREKDGEFWMEVCIALHLA